ncbi:Piso0_000444 [Millerozyma farinosa CBS 7064]|uniref:Piso0_000444 protein n=1 Tax=Pichia sorbitophila (strain ATCC MYA-4447 / BCRC 22081 / CBS 7064 / NBRC 10061 / NRRL Y-12695) TaxID=559304 RepID=G8YVG2_PICSO|nr:Piso0_000444 [Millerozyma farinosa CBS 7064]CCE73406.1 Piso0_000444 [Millerozyma farinosa CBS 7064]
MTEFKRSISEVSSNTEHDDKKAHTKPGRKPLETLPKSKRTAQNRAAQRAYRERKERRMKELEDKVKDLEDENIKATTQSDFLRAQIDLLKSELTRYRGHSDFSDLTTPYLDGMSNQRAPSRPRFSNQVSGSTNSVTSDHSSHKSSSSEEKGSFSEEKTPNSSSSHTTPSSYSGYNMSFPWSKEFTTDNAEHEKSSTSNNQTRSQHLPDLVSGSSSSTSPLNDNILVSPESNNDIGSLSGITENYGGNFDSGLKEKDQSEVHGFEEQMDPFCSKLNEACGTKDCPVPKDKKSSYSSPFTNLINQPKEDAASAFAKSSKFNFDLTSATADHSQDPLYFLDDANFDVALALDDNFDPGQNEKKDSVSYLTTEDSVYDPFEEHNGFNFSDLIAKETSKQNKHEANTNNEGLDENDDVVPAPEKTMPCSEIWDRITSHPKYTELDIDSLCNELKAKAKCSERGVVINSADVNQLLEQSAVLKR